MVMVTTQKMVERAARGDARAVNELLSQVRPPVLRYCRSRLGSHLRSSVDDVAQEVLLGVLRGLATFEPGEQSSFQRFVYGVAAHKVADALRKAGRDRFELFAEVPDRESRDVTPESAVLRREQAEALAGLLSSLPDAKRELLVLRVVLGLTTDETAEVLGMTSGSVRVAQHRVLALLRERLLASSARLSREEFLEAGV